MQLGYLVPPTSKSDVEAIVQDAQLDNDIKSALASKAGLGTINPNPIFALKDGDYKNWLAKSPDYNYVGDDVNTSSGALKLTTTVYPNTLNSDNYYPWNPNLQYRATVSNKLNVTGSGVNPTSIYRCPYYFGITPYDSDKNVIMPQNVTKQTGTQTFLAQALVNGDIEIVVEDASSWYTGTAAHLHSILMHKKQPDGRQQYIGQNGRKYSDLGYSRYLMYLGYNAGASNIVDNGNGTWTIKLKSPWTLGSFAVGDAIRNSSGGGTYNYWISSKFTTANGEWDTYSTAWGVQNSDKYVTASFARDGTSYLKLMVLPNYKLWEATDDGAGGYNSWVSLGHTTPTITRESVFDTLALEWRHIP